MLARGIAHGRVSVAAALACALGLGLLVQSSGAAAQSKDEEVGADPVTEGPADPGVEDPFEEELKGPRLAPSEGVEEIVITGEITESTTQAVPQAITTFDQSELDTLGITDVESLALNTPSLHFGQVGQQAVVTLRGVGLENLTSVGEAGVGFQVDGVHLGRPSAANSIFFDLERTSVLRGPQGTQGGRNTNGGRIELWSKKPEEDFEAFGDLMVGNYKAVTARGVLNLPIWEDKLMTRTSVIYSRREGYQDWEFTGDEKDNPDDANALSLRAQARSLLADQTVDIRVIGTYSFQKGVGPALKLIGPPASTTGAVRRDLYSKGVLDRFLVDGCPLLDSTDPNPADPADQPPEANNRSGVCANDNARQTWAEHLHDRDNQQTGITGLATWDVPFFFDTPFSDMRVGLVGSWQQNIEDSVLDFDGTNIPVALFDQRRDAKQHSFEAYIERPDVGAFDFKGGFYFYEENIQSDVCFDSTGTGPGFNDLQFDAEIKTTSLAGYGEAGVRLHEEVRLYGGIRYTNETKSVLQNSTRFQGVGTKTPQDLQDQADAEGVPLNDLWVRSPECGTFFRDQAGMDNTQFIIDPNTANPEALIFDFGNSAVGFEEETFDGLTPMIGIDWLVSDSSTLTFTATRGFKAGGFALGAQVLNPDLKQPYDSEFVWEYELTSKNDFEFFEGLFRLNTTLFWMEYDPFQICQFAGPIFFCRSDGNATIRGVEIEWNTDPFEGWSINGHFNFTDSRINTFQIQDPTVRTCGGVANSPPPCPPNQPLSGPRQPQTVDVAGNRLPRAPLWAGSFGIQYTFDLGRWGLLTPRGQTQFQGQTFFRVFNLEEFSQDPFVKLDLTLTWRSENDRLWVEGFVRNVTDVDVINSMVVGPSFTGGQVLGQYQPPRLFGLRFGINYISDLLL